MRYFLHLAYDGMPYSGWQWQKSSSNTVQHILQQQIAAVLKDDTIVLGGCGRTDSGVHASQYFAQIDVWNPIDEDFIFKVNKGLPAKIALIDAIKVDDEASTRYGAYLRRYDYFIHLHKDPFLHNRSLLIDQYDLDIPLMQSAAKLIEEYDDFEYLCNNPDKHNTTICTIKRSQLFYNEETGQLQFVIEANRFIRGMIRILTACLIDVGRGAISINDFECFLNKTKKRKLLSKVFPQGLYLSKIEYTFLSLPNKSAGYAQLRIDA